MATVKIPGFSIKPITNFYFRFEENENSVNNQNDKGKFSFKNFHLKFLIFPY